MARDFWGDCSLLIRTILMRKTIDIKKDRDTTDPNKVELKMWAEIATGAGALTGFTGVYSACSGAFPDEGERQPPISYLYASLAIAGAGAILCMIGLGNIAPDQAEKTPLPEIKAINAALSGPANALLNRFTAGTFSFSNPQNQSSTVKGYQEVNQIVRLKDVVGLPFLKQAVVAHLG